MIVIIDERKKLTKGDFEKAREDYEKYIKVTIDIEKKVIALGGEYHADAEKSLLERWICLHWHFLTNLKLLASLEYLE